MSPIKVSMLSLCLVGLGFAGTSFATPAEEKEQGLITLVAMEQVCDKANPGMKSDVENAMEKDSTIDEATKAEVRKIKADPAYKFKVSSMASNLMNSPIGAYAAKDMCKTYGTK